MKLLVTGVEGPTGSSLVKYLIKLNYGVVKLREGTSENGVSQLSWVPGKEKLNPSYMHWVDAVVHFYGADFRDEESTNYEQRLDAIREIVSVINSSKTPPSVFICASSLDVYDGDGMEKISEDSPVSKEKAGFYHELEEVVSQAKCRSVILRMGEVLNFEGGLLKQSLRSAYYDGGGKDQVLQYCNWISIRDLASLIGFALHNPNISGPVNAVAPGACSASDFIKDLSVHSPTTTKMKLPKFLIKLTKRKETPIKTQHSIIESKVLQNYQFKFEFPELKSYLESTKY